MEEIEKLNIFGDAAIPSLSLASIVIPIENHKHQFNDRFQNAFSYF